MKKTYYFIGWMLFTLLLSACTADEDMRSISNDEAGVVQLYMATPAGESNNISTEEYYPETRGGYSEGDAKVVEEKIDNVYLLLFDEAETTLKGSLKMEPKGSTKGHYSAFVKKYKNTYLRIAANITPNGDWVGQTWEELQGSITYTIDQEAKADISYPMFAEIGVKDLSSSVVIGTASAPIQLERSFAKLSVILDGNSGMTLSGFRTFGIRTKGYTFPQTAIANASTEIFNETVGAYTNNKAVIFLPETKNEETNQTFIIIKATYKGIEGFYRIDLRDNKANLLHVGRNKHYLVKVNGSLGFGYQSEDEAMNDPYNDLGKNITIEETTSNEFTYNGNGNYLNLTNSTIIIYGKSAYYETGYSGEKIVYAYLLTGIETEHTSLTAEDIEILHDGGLGKEHINIAAEGSGAYIYATFEDKEKGLYPIRFRYKNMVRTVNVYWMGEYLDCTYLHFPLTTDGTTPLLTTFAKIRSTYYTNVVGEAIENEVAAWAGLTTVDENATVSGAGDLTQYLDLKGVKTYFQLREHLVWDEADPEGFRFANFFASGVNSKGRIKYIVAQANADLSGYFGSEQLVNYSAVNNDDGSKYDSYLLSNRITRLYDPTISLEKYCQELNPKGETLWYLPSSRQLMGLWLTNNSDSRKVSPMNAEPAQGPDYPYISRSNYTQADIDYYGHARTFKTLGNPDGSTINRQDYYPIVMLSTGETKRYKSNSTWKVGVRCVRNLPNSKAVNKHVNGKTVTMDPDNRLSADYFEATGEKFPNPIARKIEIIDQSNTEKVHVFTWSSNKWNRTTKDKPEEVTLADAYKKKGSNRLPSMRELQLIYIYHPLLVQGGVKEFYKEEKDGYYEGTSSNPGTPNKLLWSMLRYPANDYTSYLFYYWSSTTWGQPFNGNDNGTVIPLRINFHFGDVNARSGNEQSAIDHYRFVKTITLK